VEWTAYSNAISLLIPTEYIKQPASFLVLAFLAIKFTPQTKMHNPDHFYGKLCGNGTFEAHIPANKFVRYYCVHAGPPPVLKIILPTASQPPQRQKPRISSKTPRISPWRNQILTSRTMRPHWLQMTWLQAAFLRLYPQCHHQKYQWRIK
jgi:hypothetical protein